MEVGRSACNSGHDYDPAESAAVSEISLEAKAVKVESCWLQMLTPLLRVRLVRCVMHSGKVPTPYHDVWR